MRRSFSRHIDVDKPFMDYFRSEDDILMRGIGSIGANGESDCTKTGSVIGLVFLTAAVAGAVGYFSRNREIDMYERRLESHGRWSQERENKLRAEANFSNKLFNDVYSEKVRAEIAEDERRERDEQHSANAVLSSLTAEPDLGESRNSYVDDDDLYSGGY